MYNRAWRSLWSGDQLIEETPIYADGTLANAQQVQWLYQPGEITPTARYQQGKLHYVVTNHQGTPREIFSEGGQASWAGRLNTWGQMQFWRYREGKAENDPNYTECPFRFAGQYEDEERGLYYNRFRYYDRETGQYLSPDPIGLLGGLNPYGYVHSPTGWVDPFGLTCCPYISALNTEERKVVEGLSDKIASGKLHTRVRHGHFENVKDIENIINNPKEIFRSGGKNPRLIFHDGENVVIVGTKGSEKGWVVTNYGPLGSEGRVSLGSIPNTPRGGIVTSESIVSGTIPSKSGTVPKAESIWKSE